jgi:hypothetical protein
MDDEQAVSPGLTPFRLSPETEQLLGITTEDLVSYGQQLVADMIAGRRPDLLVDAAVTYRRPGDHDERTRNVHDSVSGTLDFR